LVDASEAAGAVQMDLHTQGVDAAVFATRGGCSAGDNNNAGTYLHEKHSRPTAGE